jgi:hypothetical protein
MAQGVKLFPDLDEKLIDFFPCRALLRVEPVLLEDPRGSLREKHP